eukprot:scaffold4561_cov105-Isochrysis_galbana.AAC.3
MTHAISNREVSTRALCAHNGAVQNQLNLSSVESMDSGRRGRGKRRGAGCRVRVGQLGPLGRLAGY